MRCEVSLSLRSTDPRLAEVAGMVDAMIEFLREQRLPEEKFLEEFQLAATEGINNAIEHGCAGRSEAEITAELTVSDAGVRVAISDPSDFAGWTGVASLPEDPFAEGGRGRFLMEHMTDTLEHRRLDSRHVLIFTKRWPGEAWTFDPGRQERVLDSMTEALGAGYEMINALIGLGELVAGTGEMESFLPLALERVCELTGAQVAYVRLQRGSGLALIKMVGTPAGEVMASIDPQAPGVETQVFVSGEEVTVIQGSSLAPDDPLRDRVQAAFVAPIFFKHGRRGILLLGLVNRGAAFFNAAQLQVARVVAEYLGIVSAMNELQQRRETEQRALRELQIAAEIQLSLMPRNFRLTANLDVFGDCRPALRAGGDYFDFIPLAGGGALFVVADVMGKGVSAALIANMLRTSIRARLDLAMDPGLLLATVNQNMAGDLAKLEVFITVACASISRVADRVLWASAGHPAALICGGTRVREIMEIQGMPIGILSDTRYETGESAFEVGELLLLFTDGIAEANDSNDNFYDVAGIEREVARQPILSAQEVVTRIMNSVDEFSDHAPPADDRTILAIIRKS
jgi:serine phosphatase RsbU (regulator of sigma subunit)/anti-sigma regulatory factor (Ser/Thr protein kinase)